jgi:tRNA threonylcarbamoyl adenosine modification protein YeaZ
MITLAIETSTPQGSVAIVAYGDLIFDEKFTADRSHSSALFSCLERARACAARFHQIAIGLGPGSYAGVRIAISAALGFHLGTGGKLLGFSSLAALDTDAREYIVIGDARRESFYFARIMDRFFLEGPRIVKEMELRELLHSFPTQPCYATAPVPDFPSAQIVPPSALVIARLASEGQCIVMSDNLEPLYLREPHITQPRTQIV